MRLGRQIAVDYGAARIGVAGSSVDALICSPITTITNDDSAFSKLLEVVEDQNPITIYVGLPLNLEGDYTASTESAIAFAKSLAAQTAIPVRLIDERMSTRAAQSQLYASGRNSKVSRSLIDAAAASLILESAIAQEKATGQIPGKPVSEF